MVEIKSKISFDEYNAIIDKVVDDCFPNGTYSPANYEISMRTALLSAFTPDFDFGDYETNNELWDKVMSNEADEVLGEIYGKSVYYDIETSIRNAIDYRIKMITSSPMSMADMALATLFETIDEKVSQIDTSMLTKDNMDVMIQAVNATKDNQFASSLVDTMLDKGLLAKPNRETRRKNIKQTKKNTTESDK